MKKFYKAIGLFLILTLGALNAQAQTKVIGYYATWNGISAFNAIDLNKVTHINISFYNPNSGGTLTNSDGFSTANVATVVNACHAKNVKVLVSIGGAGAPGATYKTLLASSTTTANFVTNIMTFVTANNLDGVDVDIEGDVLDGAILTAAKYETFVTQLATALHAKNKVMSAALASWFASYVTTNAVKSFDYIGLMSYDAAIPGSGDQAAQHSPYTMVTDDVAIWKAKGLTADKTIVGLPFYGYGWGSKSVSGNDEIAYCDIVSANAGAENADIVGSGANAIYYNGIATIQKKTSYAIANAAGVMIWQITEDCASTSTKSLLTAIDKLVKATSTVSPTITFANVNKTYGDAAFSVTATSNSSGAFIYSATGTGAAVTSAGAVIVTGAGTVTITAKQAAATGYTAGTATAILTIAKKILTVTADAKTKVYNTANPAFSVTYSGFVNNDNAASLTTGAAASSTAIQTSDVGTYTISATNAASNNYSFVYATGKLTISAATPTLTITSASAGDAGSQINLTSTSNSVGAVTYTVISGPGTVAGTILSLNSQGQITVQASIAASGNYAATTTTQKVTVSVATSVDDSEIASGNVLVYPNPFSNVVNVRSSDIITGVSISDVAGSLIYHHDAASNNLHISTNNFPAGIYILKVSTSKGEQSIKIVK